MNLFFNYSIDCETPANTAHTEGIEREPFFGGPPCWEAAEESVRGFMGRMEALGVREGTSLFVYPDVARHQKAVYRELADAGVEIGLHLNGMRYSRLTGDKAKWLGSMSSEEQHEALRMGKEDLEESVGRTVFGYRACYGSANRDTFKICNELGFTWTSNVSNRYRPEFHSNWSGSWPYIHRTSDASNLICGALPLIEIPVTVGIDVYYDESLKQPLDLRVESPVSKIGTRRERLGDVIGENVEEMSRRDVPVRAVIGISHNTNPFGDTRDYRSQTLDWVVRLAREAAAERGMEFTPASFEAIRKEAKLLESY